MTIMDDVAGRYCVKIDISELELEPETSFSNELKLPDISIRRVISLGDFMRFIENPHPTDIHMYIADIKARVVMEDVRKFVSMGYKEIYLYDIVPSDTHVAYVLKAKE